MRHLVHHDFLTGLPNRALLLDRLRQTVTRQKRHKELLTAVLFVDLDGFKSLNDQLGHAAGDQLLKDIAQAFVACLREEEQSAAMVAMNLLFCCRNWVPSRTPLTLPENY